MRLVTSDHNPLVHSATCNHGKAGVPSCLTVSELIVATFFPISTVVSVQNVGGRNIPGTSVSGSAKNAGPGQLIWHVQQLSGFLFYGQLKQQIAS